MSDNEVPTGWLDRVQLEGADEMVRVRLEEREGNRVLLRQLDPGDPEAERVPIYSNDQIVVMQAISHIGFHTTDDPTNKQDFIFGVRVVPIREEEDAVYARTLRHDEEDAGARVHVRPGQQVRFEEGAVRAELDHIDDLEAPTESGYVPLTPVLWAWLQFGGAGVDSALVRYILSAARRLDVANALLMDVTRLESEMNADPNMGGPGARRRLFLLIGFVEMAIVALGRAFAMITKAPDSIRGGVDVPQSIKDAATTVKDIRDAYEHIEDRALGLVFGRPAPHALTIFDYEKLLESDLIVYGEHSLDLSEEVPRLLHEARDCLKSFVRSY